ncbi:unnamed protein product, partial [Schistosoma curassoni]
MENLGAIDGYFIPMWGSSVVHTNDPAPRDSNLGPIGLSHERLTIKPLSRLASNGVS